MKDKLRDEYIKHIKSITLKRDLRQFAIEFYDDLCKKYKGQVFRRDNFETLDVDEQEIEQDVAKHVFKDKDTATAEEIFTFLIKQNVKSMFIGKQKDMLDENTAGFLNPSLQLLGIKKIDLEISGVMVNSRMSKKEIKQKEKQALQEAMQVQKQKYKQVVYHELSHVFEVKTFGDRKFYKNSHGVFFKAGRLKYISTNSQYIRQENFAKDIERDQLIIKHKYQDTPTDILNSLKRNGKVAIFEIFNENSSQKIRQDELDLLRGQIIGVKSENAHCKILLEGFCGYNKNYPIF